MPASRRPGCLRLLFLAILALVAIALGILAWDVWQLRALAPPAEATFEGFLEAGRRPEGLCIDAAGERLYWEAPRARTFTRNSKFPLYEFDRRGRLINWTPDCGNSNGMIQDTAMKVRGTPTGLQEARAWLRRN